MDYNKTKKDNPSISHQDGIINNQKISNPIDTSKIMPLNTRTSANRVYGGWANSFAKAHEVNYAEILNSLNSCINFNGDSLELFYLLYKQVCSKLNLDFLAIGIYNANSNCINMKLIEKAGVSFNSKIC